jgi:hypothetical protein
MRWYARADGEGGGDKTRAVGEHKDGLINHLCVRVRVCVCACVCVSTRLRAM